MRVNYRGNYRQLLEEMLISYRLVKVEGEESSVDLAVVVVFSNSDGGNLVVMQERDIEGGFVGLDSRNEDVGIKRSVENI